MHQPALSSRILALIAARPRAATELYHTLEAEHYGRGQSKTAVSRLVKKGLIRVGRLRLGTGSTILFGPNAAGPNPALVKDLYAHEFYGRPSLRALIECLRSSHPGVDKTDVAKVAVLKVTSAKNPDWRDVEAVIDGLRELGVLEEVKVASAHNLWTVDRGMLGKAGIGFMPGPTSVGYLRSREKLRFTTARAVAEWLEQNGLIAYKKSTCVTQDKPLVTFAGLPFDVVGFSYAAGISHRKGRNADGRPLVGDVLYDRCVDGYARSFVQRVRQVAAKYKPTPMSFVFAKYFEKEAFRRLQSEGVFVWTHGQFFGPRTAEALQKSLELIEGFLRTKDLDPKLFAQAIDGLDNFGSLFGSLKGKLFELLVGYFFQRSGYECRLAWEISEKGKDFDVDVLATKNNEAVILECKGVQRDGIVPHADVTRHLTERVPAARALLAQNKTSNLTKFKGVLITTGQIDPATSNELGSGTLAPRADTQFELWNRETLIERLRSDGYTELVDIVNSYY